MNEHPLVSVVVPVYKVERWLDRCVRSIVRQSYQNLEIILVDDGSPDGCPALCDAWVVRDGRVRVIHKANGGLSDARNAGLDAMHGDLVAFVDSDDYVEPNYIEKLVDSLMRNNADIAISTIHREDENGRYVPAPYPYGGEDLTSEWVMTAHDCMKDMRMVMIVAWNKLYCRRLWKEIRYPVGKINEDEFMFHRVLEQCNKIVLIPDALYHYVARTDSIMHTKYSVRNLDGLEAHIDRLAMYARNGWHDLIAPTFELIVNDYYHALANLELHDTEEICRIRQLSKQLKSIQGGILPYLPIDNKINCLGFCNFPIAYLHLRQRIAK